MKQGFSWIGTLLFFTAWRLAAWPIITLNTQSEHRLRTIDCEFKSLPFSGWSNRLFCG